MQYHITQHSAFTIGKETHDCLKILMYFTILKSKSDIHNFTYQHLSQSL